MKISMITLLLIPIILSSLTFEFEKINEFAESGDYGQFHRLLIEDNYLYAISIYGFEINEVNEVSGELTRISLIPLEGQVDDIEKIGSNIFVSVPSLTSYQTEINSTLYKIDVSDPHEPFLVDSIIFPENYKHDILRTYGDYLAYHELEMINNSHFFTELVFIDPITFEETTSFPINAWTQPLRDNYFLKQRNPGEYIFDVYDYTDIYNIQLASSVDFSQCPTEFMIGNAIDDNTLVLLGNESISIYDISNLSDIQLVSTYYRYNNASPFGNCIKIDNFLLIPSQSAGIEVVDISDLANPVMLEFWEYPYDEISSTNPCFYTTGGLIYDNGHLYVGTFYDGILLMNFSYGIIEYVDKFINNRINLSSFEIYNNQLYATGYSGGLYVYDIVDINSPILSMIIFEDLFISNIKIVSDHPYLISFSQEDQEYYFKVYNISDLSNPVLQWDELLIGSTYFVINENEPDYIYTCSYVSILTVKIGKYSISNPEDIELVLFFDFQRIAMPSFFYEGYLYIEEYDDNMKNLLIYDGFEDEEPVLMNQIPDFLGSSKIFKVDNYLQLSNYSYTSGDNFYSLNDPLTPEYSFSTQNSSKWNGCKFKDNVLFCPSNFTVYLFDLEDNPSGELEPFDYFNLNSRYNNLTFSSQGEENYFFCMQSECISTYNYSIETFAEDELPKPDITLSNYPNPFNPETTIIYNLLEESKVKLNIYNIKGQKIKTLLSDQISAGEHSIVWNGEDSSGKKVSSGVYLYKLIVNDRFEAVKKCLLLK